MIIKLYRKYVSQDVRDKIYDAFLGYFLLLVRDFPGSIKNIYIYLFKKILPDTDENKLYAFMGKHGLTPYPYPFFLKYKKLPIDCFWDEQLGIYYVLYTNKKLYYPASYNKNTRELIVNYRSLLAEQDIHSPHQYIKTLNRLSGKTLLDVGAAEGIFTLSVIEIINHAYLFECDQNWISALKATFAPWKDKITIVPKYVSDKNDTSNITLDHFLEDKDKANLFLKMDIEGYEQTSLRGAVNTLKNRKDIDFSICTYHRKEDAEKIKNLLDACNFETEFTEGFLYYEKDFRKAIIRKKIISENYNELS
jgi:hypothetical protein